MRGIPIRANKSAASVNVTASARNSAVGPNRAISPPPTASNTMSSPSVTVASAALACGSRSSATIRGTNVASIGPVTSVASIRIGTTPSIRSTPSRPAAAASGKTRTTTPCTIWEPTSSGFTGKRSTIGPATAWRSHGSRRTAFATPTSVVEPLSSKTSHSTATV